MNLGIAGFVTIAGNGVFSEQVCQDGRFFKEIDDPNGSIESPPLQIIAVPIKSRTDQIEQLGTDSLSVLPRCIV